MNRKGLWLAFLILGNFWLSSLSLYAQALPPCSERPAVLYEPWVDGRLLCLELVIHQPDAGTLGFTALAIGEDGTLYATRPVTGEIYAFEDTNGDRLPDTARLFASGLDHPSGLAWHDGALYVVGGSMITRLADGQAQVVINSVPKGGGFWASAITFGISGELYIATGAVCDACDQTEVGRGAVLRYDEDGVMQMFAAGLRAPGDLVVYQGSLWTNDSVSLRAGEAAMPDVINRVIEGADFGYPRCSDGLSGTSHPNNCREITPPAYALPVHSYPMGMAAYRGNALPFLEGALLVALHGSRGGYLTGYQVQALWFDDAGRFLRSYALIPNSDINFDTFGFRFENDALNLRGSGFYPRRPLDVAVSPEGWVYISVTDGWILALRER